MKIQILKTSFIFLLLISVNFFSQNRIFDKEILKRQRQAYLIDSTDKISQNFFDLNINDSIKVNVLKFRQKIFTKNKLSKSRTSFQINYYLSDGKLFYVKVEEQSPNLNDLKKHIEYGISEDKICCVNYYYDMRSCLPISFYKDINEQFGYNQSLTEEFMKDYVFKLYKKINKKFR